MPGKLLEYITDMPRVVGGIDEESPSTRPFVNPSTRLHFDRVQCKRQAQPSGSGQGSGGTSEQVSRINTNVFATNFTN
jgi:hypothetical protein